MQQQTTYINWDFTKIWEILEGHDYPRLQWQIDPPNIHILPIASPQKINTPFSITLLASKLSFNGRAYIHSSRGDVFPDYVDLQNGSWKGNITVFSVGKRDRLEIRWDNDIEDSAQTNVSNTFDVTGQDGSIPSDAILNGKITNDSQLAIFGATVGLYSNSTASETPKYSTTSDKNGQYAFNNIVVGNYYLKVSKSGYQDYLQQVKLASQRTIITDVSLYSNCSTTGEVPILLVPGIMGSKTHGIVYPRLPFILPAWNSGKLILHDPHQSKVGWRNLIEILTDPWGPYKYQKGCTLFEVPYYWSLSIPAIRDKYLIPWINKAKQKSGSSKVDIIAHSMGGLVVRSYLQSYKYANDVRKFAMVGTPNKGADLVYYLWEGGDPIKADIAAKKVDAFDLGRYFYSNTIDYLYDAYYLKHVCKFGVIRRFTPKKCNNKKIYTFLHNEAPAPGFLMPIYDDALLDMKSGVKTAIQKEENTFLKALNDLTCYNPNGCVDPRNNPYYFTAPQNVLTKDSSGVQTKLFVGKDHNTINSIYVNKQNPGKILYQDGKPLDKGIYVTNADGDKTVLKASAIFNDFLPIGKDLPVLTHSGEHSKLITVFRPDVIGFITGKTVTWPITLKPLEEPNSTLVINIAGRVQPTLVSVSGSDGQTLNDVSEEISDNFNTASIVIDNPKDGLYTFTLNSSHKEHYEISASYYNEDKQIYQVKDNMGYFDGTIKSIKIGINSKSTTPILFDRPFYPPTELTMKNIGWKVQLTWQDPSGTHDGDVDHYEIFWRPDNDPHFRFLANSKNLNYLTNQSWASAGNNIYVVRSARKGGSDTFFSQPEFWIPKNE